MAEKIINYRILNFALALLVIAVFCLSPVLVSAQTAPAPTPSGSTFETRLSQRKAERNITLDDKTQKRLVSQCVRAQGKVRTLQQSTSPALTKRAKTYNQIDAKLWVMVGKLKIADKDTFNLEKQRVTYTEKVAAFNATAQLYQQSLDDLVTVNCQADPTGFKALLETAKIYRGQLRDQSNDIRDYVVNTVKPSLSSFADDLKTKPSTEEGQ